LKVVLHISHFKMAGILY